MRAGTDRLLALVVQVFGAAQAHHGYLFANARGTRLKLLVHNGFGDHLDGCGDAGAKATLDMADIDASPSAQQGAAPDKAGQHLVYGRSISLIGMPSRRCSRRIFASVPTLITPCSSCLKFKQETLFKGQISMKNINLKRSNLLGNQQLRTEQNGDVASAQSAATGDGA